MGEVSDTESNADCKGGDAPGGEAVDEEENLALEMEDYEYRDLEVVVDSEDEDGEEEGEGGDEVDDRGSCALACVCARCAERPRFGLCRNSRRTSLR